MSITDQLGEIAKNRQRLSEANKSTGALISLREEGEHKNISIREWRKRRQALRVKEIIKEASALYHAQIEDFEPHRICVAYRLTRHWARLRGFVRTDEPLSYMEDARGDLWTQPQPFMPDGRTISCTKVPYIAHLGMLLAETTDGWVDGQMVCWYDEIEKKWIERSGLALQPPPPPLAFRDESTGEVDEGGYDEIYDEPLTRFVDLVKQSAEALRIYDGSIGLPSLGRDGMVGLKDRKTVRQLWPTRDQLIDFEAQVVEELLDLMVEKPSRKALQILHQRYGFDRLELSVFTELARKSVNELLGSEDEETDRKMMIHKLEALAKQAEDAGDIRAKLACLKQISLIQGLTQMDRTDSLNEIIGAIAEVAAGRGFGQLEKPSETPLLPPVDVEVEVLEEDP